MAVYGAVLLGFCMQPADRADFRRVLDKARDVLGRFL
jgi:hypothetical protein